MTAVIQENGPNLDFDGHSPLIPTLISFGLFVWRDYREFRPGALVTLSQLRITLSLLPALWAICLTVCPAS